MECKHDLAERETACADGYCPICLLSRVHDLEEGIHMLIDFIPDGWEVPVGYVSIVSQLRKLLEEEERDENSGPKD